MLTVRRAVPDDALSLAPRLREADHLEFRATGSEPVVGLLEGVNSPDGCWAAVDEENIPHIIFGTYPIEPPVFGSIWMMASEGLTANWRQVLRETRSTIQQITAPYLMVGNAVHSHNLVHIRWLRWAGFSFLRAFEVNGELFYEFAKITEVDRV